MAGMEIETDPKKLAENEIEENANSVDFDEDVVDSEIVSEESAEQWSKELSE